MNKSDLHIHTEFSNDGEFTVEDIVKRCISNEVSFFSITDHNVVGGNEAAYHLAKEKGLEFISGIEIDCDYKGINLHVLGYNIDWKSDDFVKLEKDVYSKSMDSFSYMIENITKLGFVIDADSVLAKAAGQIPSAELIAEVMLSDKKFYSPPLEPYMEGGERSEMPYINFYLDYFAQGKPAFVPVEFMDYSEAIEMIKNNGGVPIVAHPGLNLKGKEHIVEELLDRGAAGLEVFNNYHSMEQIDYFASVVMKRDCIMTCGSDFHGKTKPLINIGQFKFDTRYGDYLQNSLQRLKSAL
ncbi:MAG: PHP domain-containing protein [Dysgonomonas sp.]|nr:PHP domain-containing protein [Dysgonomonas sp.]